MPKREETIDTYDYFGGSLFEYSLAQGIEDGFLAPYRVRRVVLSPDAQGWAPDEGQWQFYALLAQASGIRAGTTEILKNILGERVLGLPKD